MLLDEGVFPLMGLVGGAKNPLLVNGFSSSSDIGSNFSGFRTNSLD
jgi:hypothetical protein